MTLGSGPAANPNSGREVLCHEAPLSLISWHELKRAGWKVDELLTYIWHTRAEVTIYFEMKNGLLYLPIDNDGYNDDEMILDRQDFCPT